MQVGILPRRQLAEERGRASEGQCGKGLTALNSILVDWDLSSKTRSKKLSLQRHAPHPRRSPGGLWQEPYRPVLPGCARLLGYSAEKQKTEVGDVTQE